MKVVCINTSKPIPGHYNVPEIIIGDTYEVIKEGWDEDLKNYYCLK